MSIVGEPITSGRLAIETFGPVYAVLGTVVLYSRVFPVVEEAHVVGYVGTVGGLLGTSPGNLWVSAVGPAAGAPNAITVRVVTSAGDYTGTISSIVLLVRR
ncbi:MAG: hypothetical protein QXP81_09345 [Nitrososphaerota archaeon]